MNLSKGLGVVLSDAFQYALVNGYALVTPELLLLKMCESPDFDRALRGCGGDVYELAEDLEEYGIEYLSGPGSGEPELSTGLTTLFSIAGQQAASSGRGEVDFAHVAYALWELKDSYAVYYLEKQGIDRTELLMQLAGSSGTESEADDDKSGADEDEAAAGDGKRRHQKKTRAGGKNADDPESWQSYAHCLNDVLDDVNPLIGREEELERTIQILCRRDKNNPLHIGEPGVGKTAITFGLARRINEGKVPEPLIGSRIFMLDMGGMLAGTQYRGDFEKRFKHVLGEIEKEERPIVYIDEIHMLTGAGAVGEGAHDASNMLKPYLSGGHIRFIGATTFEEHKKHFEKNKSLARRFQNVEIREPSEEDTVRILEGLRERYESFHGVHYEDGVFEYAVSMSAKHINERFLPDKAIDLIDEAGSYRRLHPIEQADPGDAVGKQPVSREVISEVLTGICRVPLETVESDEVANLATLEERLGARVFGQDEALTQVVNAIKFSRAGLSEEDKPLASLLFVGPTGVGKTEVAKSLSEELGAKLIRFDMSEYTEKHAVAKLIGSPAGYVGYEEGGLLTEEIRKNPSAVLLLDEIEKAHPEIFGVLLQVMDYATLTDNQGRKADFRNVVLIMTSNAGANRLGKKGIGFRSGYVDDSALMEEVKRTFQPEFRNRLNKIVPFNGMDDEMAARVVDKKIRELGNLLGKKNIEISADDEARSLILERGISREFGAREVDRVIRNDVKPLFVDEILFGRLKDGGRIVLSVSDGEFAVTISP